MSTRREPRPRGVVGGAAQLYVSLSQNLCLSKEGDAMSDIRSTEIQSIRDAGHDEYWLRDRIYDDPSILGLGDLQAVMKERTQSQGGRLDLLLKDPDDDSMFEVEIQLGATDETHIVRTIEYWDNEKRKWPNRSHTAVLVAEEITNRFFNVVHLLSQAVPVIGIKVTIIKIGEATGLHFAKVIDSYQEPEDIEPSPQTYTEKHWIDNNPEVLECIKWYREILVVPYKEIGIKYFENYVSLTVGGIARVWINRRKNGRALFEIKCASENIDELMAALDKEGISYGTRSNKNITFNANLQQLKEKKPLHEIIGKLIGGAQ